MPSPESGPEICFATYSLWLKYLLSLLWLMCNACSTQKAVLIVTPTKLFCLLACLNMFFPQGSRCTISDVVLPWRNILHKLADLWKNRPKNVWNSSEPNHGWQCSTTLLVTARQLLTLFNHTHRSDTPRVFILRSTLAQHAWCVRLLIAWEKM